MALDLFGNEVEDMPIMGKGHHPRGIRKPKKRGYAATPGEGPEGETCGSCRHRRRDSRGWSKCYLARPYWTGSSRTDIYVASPACKKWESAIESISPPPLPAASPDPRAFSAAAPQIPTA